MSYNETTEYFKPYLTNTSYHNNYQQRKVGKTRIKFFAKQIIISRYYITNKSGSFKLIKHYNLFTITIRVVLYKM